MISDQYAAGFIDGEGSIGLNRVGRSHCLRLYVSQNDHRPLHALVERYGGSVYPHNKWNKRRRAGRWIASSTVAATALRAMLPYLIVKREQAILALKFQDSLAPRVGPGIRPGVSDEVLNERDNIMAAISVLNQGVYY